MTTNPRPRFTEIPGGWACASPTSRGEGATPDDAFRAWSWSQARMDAAKAPEPPALLTPIQADRVARVFGAVGPGEAATIRFTDGTIAHRTIAGTVLVRRVFGPPKSYTSLAAFTEAFA